jgi:hypothetical protein
MVRDALVTIDAGLLPGEQISLVGLGGARALPCDIHGIISAGRMFAKRPWSRRTFEADPKATLKIVL